MTLAEIKTRIISETNRDDLADDLAVQLQTHIASACEYYADTRFWFNAIVTTVDTTAASDSVAIPATVRLVERVTLPAYYTDLQEVTLPQLGQNVANALPSHYAYCNDTLLLWPTPDAAYTLQIVGTAQIDAPTADADTNVWTTEAGDLIVAHTKFTLYRGQFRDPEAAQWAKGETTDALARLKRETARRLETPLRTNRAGARFNINRGY